MLTLGTNVASLVAQRHLAHATSRVAKSYSRLSSGLRITRPADDIAGFRVAEGLAAKTRALRLEMSDTSDQIGEEQVAEAGLGSITDLLHRLRELAVSAHDGTKTEQQRAQLDLEYQELLEEVDRTAASTKIQGKSLLWYASTEELGLDGTSVFDVESVKDALPALDDAIDEVGFHRIVRGAQINVLEARLRVLASSLEATVAAESRIRDVDYAAETAELTSATIVQQAALSVLAQANAQPKVLLDLLKSSFI